MGPLAGSVSMKIEIADWSSCWNILSWPLLYYLKLFSKRLVIFYKFNLFSLMRRGPHLSIYQIILHWFKSTVVQYPIQMYLGDISSKDPRRNSRGYLFNNNVSKSFVIDNRAFTHHDSRVLCWCVGVATASTWHPNTLELPRQWRRQTPAFLLPKLMQQLKPTWLQNSTWVATQPWRSSAKEHLMTMRGHERRKVSCHSTFTLANGSLFELVLN